ncbi:MAG: dihydroorotate dehydrogenase electron transfer subunit [bacterium]|nr:dihydroorotate dehydrogenase electron transfer subunit [bacterium]
MKYLEAGTVTEKHEIRPGLFQLRLHSPKIGIAASPGQFLHIRIGNGTDPLLRRPFSIQRIFGEDIEIILKVYGRGSGKLRDVTVGSTLNVLGPVGSLWNIPTTATSIVGVSGGVGIAPVLFQQQRWQGAIPFQHFVGSRTAEDVPVSEAVLSEYGIQVATDDGSLGFHGTVVDYIDHHWNSGAFGAHPFLITCGPWMMMKALVDWATKNQIAGQLSAEARMGCAVGVCQGCALARPHDEGGATQYFLCCKDGPVFDFGAIDMEVYPFGN